MGLLKKIFRPVRKIAKKIIPKEIRPALPYIAAFYGGPAMAGSNTFLSGIGNATLRNAISKGLIAGATAAATDDDANILRTAALAAAPDAISGGLGNVAGRIDPNLIADSDSFVQIGDTAAKTAGALSRASEGIKAAGALKTIGTQTAIDSAAKFAELNQAEIDKYNQSLLSQGMKSKADRRSAIFQIYMNTGAYAEDDVNSMLDRYGYATGGIIGFANGGFRGRMQEALGLTTMKDLLKGKRKAPIIEITEDEEVVMDEDDDDEDRPIIRKEPDYSEMISQALSGVDAAFGRPLLQSREPMRMGFARGGEVEIEEQVDDLGIIDLMRDQGVEYGEQVSNAQNDELLEKLFEEFLDLGFSPEDAAKKAREAFDNMSQRQGIEGTQVASGYKTDIEDMYDQYVFEMEEQGLQPMSFSEFLAQARSGMAYGGSIHHARRMEDGGLMNKNLLNTGMDKDMRGGGFIPEGTKEKADDVPARLSKNEFVMTADAVRAAGGGSVNEGAKRMYDTMHRLEAKV